MWDSALLRTSQFVTDALLHRPVLPREAFSFEKVSGVMAVRAALLSATSKTTLIFAVPEVTDSTARQITAALLIGDHAHRHAATRLPVDEAHPLFKGNLLLVTQAVSESKHQLDDLPIGKGQHLSELWDVASLSKYTASTSNRPRVFVANPGWLERTSTQRRFSAVIIDASHPRTFHQLPELIRFAQECSSLRIVVTAPPADSMLASCGYPGSASLWLWDPRAQDEAGVVVGETGTPTRCTTDRFLWVCDSDQEASSTLKTLHDALMHSARSAAGRTYPGLQQCWSVYNRLRQLLVPLAQLEQLAARTWSGSLRERIDSLASIKGHGDVAWDTTWPALVEAVKVAYDTFLKREESAKFWAVASNLEAFLASAAPHLRVVIGSEAERELLVPTYGHLIDGFSRALAEGRIEFVTTSAESRLVAEGQVSATVLLAPRTGRHKHLDIFPSKRVDEFLYPHEAPLERASQERIYRPLLQAMTDEHRMGLLRLLGFDAPAIAIPRTPAQPPNVVVRSAAGHEVRLVAESATTDELDIDSLVSRSSEEAYLCRGQYPDGASGDGYRQLVEIRFARGASQVYGALQNVDVYFSEAGSVQRHPAQSVCAGWQVISFVDGRYDSLFQRLTDLVTARLRPSERIALELWRATKESIVARFQSKRALYDELVSRGLTTGYGTFIRWFGNDEDSVIAPQHFEEFAILAKVAETYRSNIILDTTFRAIQHERGRNRAAGHKLKTFLRAIVSGDGYEEALASARKLDTSLGDVLAAVEILEVVSVSQIERNDHA